MSSINITKRDVKRKLRDGTQVVLTRFVVNFKDPETGRRSQKFFELRREAETFKQQLITDINNGDYFSACNEVTIADIINLWFSEREGRIKPNSLDNHKSVRPFIIGPLLTNATAKERSDFTMKGVIPKSSKVLHLLRGVKVKDLGTRDIRHWYYLIEKEVGPYSAGRAKMLLKSALELGAEDYGYRPPAMPNIIETNTKPKKKILSPEQVGQLLVYAEEDVFRGIYYAFPFLAGTRPSEQLALLWRDVDFGKNVVRICRSQDQKGNIYNNTKTSAGMREIPMSGSLRSIMRQHKLTCTRLDGELNRVFPGLGRPQAWPKPRIGGGGQLLYQNWRKRFWVPGLEAAGVPYVTPHSARHAFISNLQAQGVEVGLVAKIAGHANPMVTLGHYTQAVRGGQEAIQKIDEAYSSNSTVGI